MRSRQDCRFRAGHRRLHDGPTVGPCQLSNKREKDHCSRYTTGATELGSCLTDVTRERSLPKSRSCVTAMLCPNESHNNHRGLLIRWNHLDLRVTKAAIKFWTKICRCQVSYFYQRRTRCPLMPH